MAIPGHVRSSSRHSDCLWTNRVRGAVAHFHSQFLLATRRTRIDALLRKLVKVAGLSLRGGGAGEKLAGINESARGRRHSSMASIENSEGGMPKHSGIADLIVKGSERLPVRFPENL